MLHLRYDADENGNQTNTAAENPQVSQPTTLSDIPTQHAEIAAPQPVEHFQDNREDTRDAYQNSQSRGGNQNGGGSQDPGFASTAAVTTNSLDTEPQGTGIKEDG